MTPHSSSPSKPKPKHNKKRPFSNVNGGKSHPKRTKSPGVRLLNGRIYDSDNGKTCHQCRQKTMDFVASCKNQNGNKPCTVHICHKCLLNRYGEIAEEVALVDNWPCPKCRGICNCSFCMKKKGHKPTGMLIKAAKATGFTSASELIQEKGAENLDIYKAIAQPKKLVLPKKFHSSNRESKVLSPSEMDSSYTSSNETSNTSESTSVFNVNKKKKIKIEGLENVSRDKSVRKRPKPSGASERQEMKRMGKDGSFSSGRKKSKIPVLAKVSSSPIKPDNVRKRNDGGYNQDNEAGINASMKPQGIKKCVSSHKKDEIEFDLSLPKVNILRTALGIDLSPEDIGHALQFLEFCASFGKACKLPKKTKEKMDEASTPCNYNAVISCLENPTSTH